MTEYNLKHIPKKYFEGNVAERYKDASQRIFLAQQAEASKRKPGEVKLGPYLTVSNCKPEIILQLSEKEKIQTGICNIL